MRRILVVDDMMFMRKTLTKQLEDNGFIVVGEAGDGEEAVQMYMSLYPDIVTMDVTMPVMDGIEALEEIMKIDENAKVIMISAVGQQSIVMQAIKLGAKSFIVKPFNKEKVIETINNVVSLYDLQFI